MSALSKWFNDLPELLQMVRRGLLYTLILQGQAGIGKTTFIRDYFKTDTNFMTIGGHLTPYHLYRILYNWRDNCIIFFDDTDGIMGNRTTREMLKQALDTNIPRRVMWGTSRPLSDLPYEFEFSSRVIFTLNQVPNDDGFKAILSRADKREFNFKYADIIAMMEEIARKPRTFNELKLSPVQRQEILEYIKKNSDETTEECNLRLQWKLENYYLANPSEWKDMAMSLLGKKDDLLVILKECLGRKDLSVEQQAQLFAAKTKKSRRTFFMKKKLLKQS